MTFEIINPESLGAPKGWNHGMLARSEGRLLFVAGQNARDQSGEVSGTDFVEQFERALEKVLEVVRASGGGPTSIGRMTIYVTNMERYQASLKPLGQIYRQHMGRHYPAMALVEVKSLVDDGAMVEIEATAVV